MQTCSLEDKVRKFHYVGHKFWKWAYIRFAEDLKQEAALCALTYDNNPDYLKKCNHHIRKLLRGFGYIEAAGTFDRLIQIDKPESDFWDDSMINAIEYLKMLYDSGMDYYKICNYFGIGSTSQRIQIRDLIRHCFAGAKN